MADFPRSTQSVTRCDYAEVDWYCVLGAGHPGAHESANLADDSSSPTSPTLAEWKSRFKPRPDAPPGPVALRCRYCAKHAGIPTHKGTPGNYCVCPRPTEPASPTAPTPTAETEKTFHEQVDAEDNAFFRSLGWNNATVARDDENGGLVIRVDEDEFDGAVRRSHAAAPSVPETVEALRVEADGWYSAASGLSADLTSMANARDAWREFAYHVAGCVVCGQTSYTDCPDGNELHEAAKTADQVLDKPLRASLSSAPLPSSATSAVTEVPCV